MDSNVPTFGAHIVVGFFLAALPITWLALRRLQDAPTRFLIATIWLRCLLSALHPYTYPPIIGGLSLNAVASVMVTGVGLMVIDKRLLKLKALGGIYLTVAVALISAVINGRIGVIDSLAKWGFLIVLTLAAYEAFQRHGSVALLSALLTVFVPPLALQLLSVTAGVGKGNELNGELCFIGGYSHESAFSIIVLTFLYCACFLEQDRPKLTLVCAVAAIGSLLFANYRTSILAALPILAGTIFVGAIRRFSRSERPIFVIVFGVVATTLFYVSAIAMQQRFHDMYVILSNSASLLKPPAYYTDSDADLLSGRVILWSRYITAYLNGSITNLAFGFGPDAWKGVFPLYAHNTFVSALYECGLFGLASMAILFGLSFKRAFKVTYTRRHVAMCGHIGFLVLNLATMPLWMIEGNVLLALLLAYTLHAQRRWTMHHANATRGVNHMSGMKLISYPDM